MNNCYFCSTNAIFAVQMLFLQYKCYFCSTNTIFFWCAEQKKFERAVQTFAVLWLKFCHLMARVLPQYKLLPTYGASFAALWPSTKKQSAVQKSVAFSGGGEGVCVDLLGQHAAVINNLISK